MLIYCQMSGSGTDSDPYDVPLPTKTLTAIDYINIRAICSVPDSDIPTVMQQLDNSHFTTYANGVTALSNCPAGVLVAWYALLDKNYPTHAGQFRPQVG